MPHHLAFRIRGRSQIKCCLVLLVYFSLVASLSASTFISEKDLGFSHIDSSVIEEVAQASRGLMGCRWVFGFEMMVRGYNLPVLGRLKNYLKAVRVIEHMYVGKNASTKRFIARENVST
ncbi:hypothetical protein OROMI_019413 [Orobanche minor]